MDAITYSLSSENGYYYEALSRFTDEVVEKAKLLLPPVADFEDFVVKERRETLRTTAEYHLELLSMALYWHNYNDAALNTSKEVADLCVRLLHGRKTHPQCKSRIDSVRGILNSKYLLVKEQGGIESGTTYVERFVLDFERLDTLMRWMAATGEFKEEYKRFDIWRSYLKSTPLYFSRPLFRGAAVLAHWFKERAETVLGPYTRNVNTFRTRCIEQGEPREDAILRTRKRSDYHLIMVGAEIMNRALKTAFAETRERIVLLPGCMRPVGHECKASGNGNELQCKQCNSSCNIGRVTALGKGRFGVRVILHASDFTSLLKKWQRQNEIGLVATACVLHLFTGGYEMQDLEISAQCVFLEHCGCKCHWHEEGIPTAINETRLLEVAEAKPSGQEGDGCGPCLSCA